MVTVERTAMTVQLEEQEPRFQPPDLSPDRDREEVVLEEAVLDLDGVEDTVVSGFSFTCIHLTLLNLNP